MTATTVHHETLTTLADAYRAHRDTVDALTPAWTALRDPDLSWQQTLLRLHDLHHQLADTAEKLSGALTAAAAWFRAADSDPDLANALDHDPRFTAITVDAFPPYGVTTLANPGWFYIVHYPDQVDEIVTDAQRLVEQQRRYLRDAWAPAT